MLLVGDRSGCFRSWVICHPQVNFGTSPAMTCTERALPPKPFRLARQLDGLDLLKLDGALFDEVVQVAVGRAGYLGAIEIDLERAAMVLVGPGGRIANPFHTGRHPIGLLVETIGDVVAGRAPVLNGPVDGFLPVERG